MRLRALILGNSHLACLKQAHAAQPDRWPNLDVSFLGAHKNLLLDTTCRDGKLIPTSPDAAIEFRELGGQTAFELASFDVFVLAGCLISLSPLIKFHSGACWLGLPSMSEISNLALEDRILMSEAAIERAAVALLKDRLGCRLLRHLGRMSDRPMLLTSQPRLSAAILSDTQPKTRMHRSIIRLGDAAEMSRLFDTAASEAVERSGGVFLPQPDQTRHSAILTKRSFMDGAIRLSATANLRQPEDDVAHANANYGAAVLDQIAETLDVAARRPD